jgi:hypothetical protein
MRVRLATFVLIFLSPNFSGAAAAQVVGGGWDEEYVRTGDSSVSPQFGRCVAGGGDVDGDGVGDFLVGAPFDGIPWDEPGSVSVYSGATGGRLFYFFGPQDYSEYGASADFIGDVDFDGHDDVIIGCPLYALSGIYGLVQVRSGSSGAVLFSFHDSNTSVAAFGRFVAGVGDINNDGCPDFAIGTPGFFVGTNGRIDVRSGLDGSLLLTMSGAAGGDRLGSHIAAAGDLNQDGYADVLVGASGIATNYVLSGADGSVLYQISGTESGVGLDDLDGDGHPDFALTRGGGETVLYSGATGLIIRTLVDSLGAHTGGPLAVAGDVDQDGVLDFIMGPHVYSGFDGETIQRFVAHSQAPSLGRTSAGIGDVDADGTADFVLADSYANGFVGAIVVVTHGPFLTTSGPGPFATSGPDLQFDIDLPWSEGNRHYVLLASAAGTGPTSLYGVAVPLTLDGILARTQTGWSPNYMVGRYGILDNDGNASAQLSSGSYLAASVGCSVHVAAVAYDPIGPTVLRSSMAVLVTVQP